MWRDKFLLWGELESLMRERERERERLMMMCNVHYNRYRMNLPLRSLMWRDKFLWGELKSLMREREREREIYDDVQCAGAG